MSVQQARIQAAYLDQLGIQQWMPRQILPAAKPSPDWVYRFAHPADLLGDDEEVMQALAPQAHKPVEPHAERRAITQIGEALEVSAPDEAEVGSSNIRRAAVAELTADESSKEPQTSPTTSVKRSFEPAPRYKIVMARAGRLLLIDNLPIRAREGFSNKHKRLLAGIVQALGESPQSITLPITLEWPMLAGKTLDQGPHEARKHVQRQLSFMQKESGLETVILFGEGLANWVVGEGVDETHGQLLPLQQSGLNYLTTQSLSQALNMPGAKQQIWSDLQPLV
ncbi:MULTISPECIES: hypothetical protein [unclassified Marinobacterium]|jgi:hypothetical protein|uniref:hypothetical protein n=1 Tax=unclassified Marinobacterium TaxID=2644139 RepID=UPI00156967B3|nr:MULTISPECIES: hypothetical protein [unclassified Marinobacterium]NRP11184.1 hypothetical protein [Marinobacterium sp. xm-g-48]NRP16206.1 hypothetical protein [Marinobacterium sp. xm-a-152]NRP28132.1 hypothetical protein [Marinobacterium sp. xm-d-420]NRP37304.1 hypothetical protein [Marinobacterium sp. xm-d-579]NRP38068.1 hypothetical protein [Marinobacterium sp. xm-a-121]